MGKISKRARERKKGLAVSFAMNFIISLLLYPIIEACAYSAEHNHWGDISKIEIDSEKKLKKYEKEAKGYDNNIKNGNIASYRKEAKRYEEDAVSKANNYKNEAIELKRKSFEKAEHYVLKDKLFRVSDKNVAKDKEESSKYRKLVFISLSMNKKNLEQIIRDAKLYSFVPVMRGFKDGSYKETALFLQEMIKKTDYGVVIDPESFKEFEVKVVPTFVVAHAKPASDITSAKNDNKCHDISKPNALSYDKIAGNVSFEYVVNLFNKSGEVLNR